MGRRNTDLEHVVNNRLWGAISRSRLKGWKCDIDADYLTELHHKQKGVCALSGLPLYLARGQKGISPYTWSLDRIDSSRGYLKGNVRIVCMIANICKADNSDETVFEFARRVVKYGN